MTNETRKSQLKHDVRTHFDFGKNWAAYAEGITEGKIRESERGLAQLLSSDELNGKTFLDIGSGSGLHSLAALNLGAERVLAIDIDEDSVATTKRTLDRFCEDGDYECLQQNIFDESLARHGKFDVVYSWGVLHHTGDMWQAIDRAIAMVAPGGVLVIAIYRETHFCGVWRFEKKLYTALPSLLRLPLTLGYCGLVILALAASGTNPVRHILDYRKVRGMSWYRDQVDWLGGYPYESASAESLNEFVGERGGRMTHSINASPRLGLLGSGCGEYVFRFHGPDASAQ